MFEKGRDAWAAHNYLLQIRTDNRVAILFEIRVTILGGSIPETLHKAVNDGDGFFHPSDGSKLGR